VRVCLGGTFDPFHAGHEALLRAVEGGHLFVGVTVGELAARPDRTVASFEERRLNILAVVPKAKVEPLEDGIGPAADGEYDAIVVSPETVAGAEAINRKRAELGKPALKIIQVPHVLAEDLLPISATRIYAGDIDRDGKRLTPLRVRVGSENPVKIAGTKAAFERLISCELDVRGAIVKSGVPEQPTEGQMVQGAANRARAAGGEYGVGIEAGLYADSEGDWFDVQCAAIWDGSLLTKGSGPSFKYPDFVTRRALAGELISEIIGPIANDASIGGTTGAIGFLTGGVYLRQEFTEQAVLMAMVPRISQSLY
jgi:inosine/xanthosine triphosphatase